MIENDDLSPPRGIGVLLRRVSRARYLFLAVVLILLGLAVGAAEAHLSAAWLAKFAKHFGEALVIAGVLALAVDPLLKRELMEHAQARTRQDVIEAAVGYPLPHEIQVRMRDWMNVKRANRNNRVVYRFIEVDIPNNRVRVEAEQEYEAQNLTYTPQEIRHSKMYADYEGVRLLAMSCYGPSGEEIYHYKADQGNLLQPEASSAGEGRAKFQVPQAVVLPPTTRSHQAATSLKFRARWIVEGPASWGENHSSWSTPAIGLRIQIAGGVPPGMKIRIDGPDPDVKTPDSWEWHRAVMPFEVIAVRWFPTPQASSSVASAG